MSYDLLIKNGTVVDGTGAARVRADVAIANGKIEEIGTITESAKRTIDASDLIVAPGFIDPHTHYDAQICWDPLVTCTSLAWRDLGGDGQLRRRYRAVQARGARHRGVGPGQRRGDSVRRAQSAASRGTGTTFPQFMDAAQKRGSGINLGFMAPLTPFRHFVMGEESMQREATPEETAKIAALIKEAVAAGAFGWSTTTLPQHIGFQGTSARMPPREPRRVESLRGRAARARQGSDRSCADAVARAAFRKRKRTCSDFCSMRATRPVTWLAHVESAEDIRRSARTRCAGSSRSSGAAAIPQVLPKPFIVQMDLRNPFTFADTESWNPIFNQPRREAEGNLSRQGIARNRWREEMKKPRLFAGKWHRVEVLEVTNPAMKGLERKTVAEIAEERGADPLDTFLDLALEDDLANPVHDGAVRRERHRAGSSRMTARWSGCRTAARTSNMLCDAGYCTYLLGHWVREKQAITLEQGIKRLTTEPADFFGIKDRGRLKKGFAAMSRSSIHKKSGRRDGRRCATICPAADGDSSCRRRASNTQSSMVSCYTNTASIRVRCRELYFVRRRTDY